MSLAEFLFQLRCWGWAVTGGMTARDPRANLRDAHVAALCELPAVDPGWWDKDVAELWRIPYDRGLGTTRPPFWFALAGLAWAERGWWLDEAQP